MTLKKWLKLFEHYRNYHNFKTKQGLFKVPKVLKHTEEWLPD
ncbi:hypothetical protein FACS189465_2220 [Clostridia bacterium]|nr:hypothetical protein FACS189465_2220 [Clostridia bacterium]